MSTVATETRAWVSTGVAARILDVSRDTLLKRAEEWGIRIRAFPSSPRPLRQVNRMDLHKALARAEGKAGNTPGRKQAARTAT